MNPPAIESTVATAVRPISADLIRAAELLEQSAEPFDEACRLIRETIAAHTAPIDYPAIWDAFVAGAHEWALNPKADTFTIRRAADAYCKLIHSRVNPEEFKSLTTSDPSAAAQKEL